LEARHIPKDRSDVDKMSRASALSEGERYRREKREAGGKDAETAMRIHKEIEVNVLPSVGVVNKGVQHLHGVPVWVCWGQLSTFIGRADHRVHHFEAYA
jgi:hypothetical protein